MSKEFEISMVYELTHFLGLQIKQSLDAIFISQTKYAWNLVKSFGLEFNKLLPLGTNTKITKDTQGNSIIFIEA